jgi:UDP-N-acetylglucosamine 1-carboxyvinyltransferase
MPEKFIIQGGKPLEGQIKTNGYKNSAGAILIATLLTDEECVIENIPLINDVLDVIKVLEGIGVKTEWLNETTLKMKNTSLDPEKMDFDRARKTRLSVLFIGALLARLKSFRLARPGGDRIGLRPISTHLEALEEMGAEFRQEGDFYYFKGDNLKGSRVVLQEFSVTATENLMMAAVLTPGVTILKGVAAEPNVQDLGKMLRNMGADIEGEGTHDIRIKGVAKLNGVKHRIVPDPLEAGTFMAAGAVTPGTVVINEVVPEHLTLFLTKMKKLGVDFEVESDSLLVRHSPNLSPLKIQALPYPGFPTDLLPLVVPLLTQAKGKSLIHDPLYENRLRYANELRKMGGDIEMVDPHRAFVFGPTKLTGVTIESTDIRAGAALVVAGLMAEGTTIIEGITQIDRGYAKIEERLNALGADISRINE